MRHGAFNPMDGRRHELTRPEPPMLVGESGREAPAFRLHVLRSLRMHPVLAASVAAVVFVLVVAYALARKPVFTAESLIYVEPLEVRVLTDGSSSGYDPSRYDSYLQQQVQTVERADTLEAAVAKIPAGVWGPPAENVAVAARRLLNSLKVDRVLNSYELGIDVTAGSPAAAAAGANAVAAAYLEAGRKDEHARADQRLQLLTEERQRITDDMTEDKTEQATLGRNLGVANPNGASGNPYDLQSEGLRSQLAAAREAHDAVAAQLASVAGQNGNGLETAANEMILTDAGLVSIRQTLSQRRAVLSDQMAGLTPANPVYKQDQEEIAGLDRAMERATSEARQRAERQLQDKLRLDLGRTADVEGRLNAQLAQQTSKATGAGPKLQRAAELETDLQRLSTRFATVDDAIRGLQLETGGPGQAHLAMAARVPDSAQPSRSRLLLLLALPLALFCGVGAAVVARKRDPRLYLAGDIQETLGFPPMCVLPNASEVSAAAYDEFVLRLAGGLEGAYRHGGARSFVFTPVSVGGHAVAMLPQLCKKLRQIGYRAVCVSADELMPSSAKTMESGTHEIGPVRAREGFATTKLERLLEEYDLVLVVAPPLLGSAVAEYTVRSADATILLVESARTNRGELRRAAMLLERLNPQGIGAVLEDLPLEYADPVFRAAVQAADSWPMMPMKRAPEKARTASTPAHKPATPEIRLPVATVAMPVKDKAAEESEVFDSANAEEEAYAEEEAEVVVETPPPPAKEVARATHTVVVEHERKAAPPAEHVPVPTPSVVLAAAQPEVGMMDEEPVSISTEFKPVSFHDASEAPRPSEIKYFTEKLAGHDSAPVSRAATAHEHHEPVLPVETRAEDVDRWEWATAHVEAQPEGSFDEPVREVAAEPVGAEVFAQEGQFESLAQTVLAAETVEDVPEEELAVEEVPAMSAVPAIGVDSVAERAVFASQEPKPLSWFQRTFGTGDEQTLRVTPESAEAFEASGAPAKQTDLMAEESGLAEHASPVSGEDAERADAVGVIVAAEPETVAQVHPEEKVEPSFRESDEAASEEIVRDVPPIAFEELLWIRGSRIAHPDEHPRVHFFLDLSQQPMIEAEAHGHAHAEVLEAPVTEVSSAESGVLAEAEAHVAPQGELDLDPELVAKQDDLVEIPEVEQARHAAPESGFVEPAYEEPAYEEPVHAQPAHEQVAEVEQAAEAFAPIAEWTAEETKPKVAGVVEASERLPVPSEREHETPFVPLSPGATPTGTGQLPQWVVERTGGQRAGLVRAMRQAGIEEGPPARASEGLAAMRTGSGLRKAVVRQEAVLRAHVQPAEPLRTQAGMSRRWGMLSRFERIGPASETGELAGTAPKNGTDSSK